MKLDETILQSNTCIELIEFLKEVYCEDCIEMNSKMVKKYNYIMKKAGKALLKRSRGYQITDIFTRSEISDLNLEQMLKKREAKKLKKQLKENNVTV